VKEVPAKVTDAQKQIIKAAKSGDSTMVRTLVLNDATLLDARDTDGSTPLHCASWKGHVDVVQALIELGADVNAQNKNEHWGNTPLHAAAHGNQRAVAEILLPHGADMNAKFGPGRTPLRETEVHKAQAVANLLRKHGATH
jgi:ankyrin repeat protein